MTNDFFKHSFPNKKWWEKILNFLGWYLQSFIERYSFSVNGTFTLGDSKKMQLSGKPSLTIRAQRMLMNAPCPNFCIVHQVVIDGMSVLIGSIDAYMLGPLMVGGRGIALPTIQKEVIVDCEYTGLVPPAYVTGNNYIFVTQFDGPTTPSKPKWRWQVPYWARLETWMRKLGYIKISEHESILEDYENDSPDDDYLNNDEEGDNVN